MEDLERYQKINSTETREELFQTIADIADENGNVCGLPVESLIINVNQYFKGMAPADVIPKEFGVRQQAMYLMFYGR